MVNQTNPVEEMLLTSSRRLPPTSQVLIRPLQSHFPCHELTCVPLKYMDVPTPGTWEGDLMGSLQMQSS